MVEVLQAATRMLSGVALRSLDVLGNTVSLPQFRVLAVLGALGRARSTRVARALGLDASSVTRLADRLVAAGYVARGSDPRNRIGVTLELTDTGQDLVTQVAEWRRRELTLILGRLEPDERDTLTAALRRLVEVAGEGYGAVAQNPVPLLQRDLDHRYAGPGKACPETAHSADFQQRRSRRLRIAVCYAQMAVLGLVTTGPARSDGKCLGPVQPMAISRRG
jgi:DNA-binding MarR family transcriptional regulator